MEKQKEAFLFFAFVSFEFWCRIFLSLRFCFEILANSCFRVIVPWRGIQCGFLDCSLQIEFTKFYFSFQLSGQVFRSWI